LQDHGARLSSRIGEAGFVTLEKPAWPDQL